MCIQPIFKLVTEIEVGILKYIYIFIVTVKILLKKYREWTIIHP